MLVNFFPYQLIHFLLKSKWQIFFYTFYQSVLISLFVFYSYLFQFDLRLWILYFSGSNGSKGVLCIPQSSSITRASTSDYLVWYPEHTYSSYVRIRDVALKTCQRRWTIGRSGERGSEISMLAARHDEDDDHKWWNTIWSLCGNGFDP